MIDLSYYQQEMCECGDPECLGSTHVAAAMVQTLPVLRAPMQRLLNERDEARRMCEVLAAALPDLAHVTTSPKAMAAASNEVHTALLAYVKLRKGWDEGSEK